MSKRMTSETIIFDTDWLTEDDFDVNLVTVSIDYQAYDTLKIIVTVNDIFNPAFLLGGLFQEIDVYKLENFGPDYQVLLEEITGEFMIDHIKYEGYFELTFGLDKSYWENELKGIGSIYIKGVKR